MISFKSLAAALFFLIRKSQFGQLTGKEMKKDIGFELEP